MCSKSICRKILNFHTHQNTESLLHSQVFKKSFIYVIYERYLSFSKKWAFTIFILITHCNIFSQGALVFIVAIVSSKNMHNCNFIAHLYNKSITKFRFTKLNEAFYLQPFLMGYNVEGIYAYAGYTCRTYIYVVIHTYMYNNINNKLVQAYFGFWWLQIIY